MPNPEPRAPLSTRQKTVAGGFAAAVAIAAPFVAKWEGLRTDPYRDIAGISTVCYGETRMAMRRYSRAECEAMLTRALANDFASAVQRCVPAIAERPEVFAASIAFSYNIGTAGFCRSTTARRFNAGDWRGGCEAMLRWNMAGGRVIQGLVRRRADESALCLKGAR